VLARVFHDDGHEVIVLDRTPAWTTAARDLCERSRVLAAR
jgi:hypothetical protein